MDKILKWDCIDDYFIAFFNQFNQKFEIVIRKNFDKAISSYSMYVQREYNNGNDPTIVDESYDDYLELHSGIIDMCPDYFSSLDIPSKSQLSFAKCQWEEFGEAEEDKSAYEICTECYDPDCINDTGGCNT